MMIFAYAFAYTDAYAYAYTDADAYTYTFAYAYASFSELYFTWCILCKVFSG